VGGGEQACFPQSSITWEILWLSCGLAIGQVTERCFLPGALILVLLDALGVVCADSLRCVARRIFMDVLSFFAQLHQPPARDESQESISCS
jgi:hypothetical protein